MAELAIKGHATKGNKVIEILEMLGGVNHYKISNADLDLLYTIRIYDNFIIGVYPSNTFVVFTLEEFLEKFPYKVGDKVYYDNKVCYVIEMLWNSNLNTISYGVYDGKIKNLAIVKELKSYKEETMKTITIDDFKANTKEWLIDKLHGMIISNAIKTIGDIHDELHKIEYPKTYEECCDVLNIPNDERYIDIDVPLSYNKTLKVFTRLLICRDAYWKIAGEHMGLGKSWEPDMLKDKFSYAISYQYGYIQKNEIRHKNAIFTFPTAEMRDAFKENFDKDIEFCKEFL